MKIEKPINSNYAASIVCLPSTRFDLVGLDNLKGVNIFGFHVIVSNDSLSELGVFFPCESQLSDEYCFNNNLYRHSDKNKYPDQKGYIEDNRRIRAIKFKGNTSNGFFMPLSSLEFTGIDLSILKEGDEFDTLNGHEICRKFELPHNTKKQIIIDRGFVRADKKFMPEHIDTENFFKNYDKIDLGTEVIITQKIHGTSIRIANTMVNHKLTFVEKIAKFFGANIQKYDYDYLYGSRKVIKDANNPNQNHYYEMDLWSLEGHKLNGLLPENYIVYAELVGWTPDGKPIQKDYTYGLPVGTCELYVYRIAIVNEKGLTTDLSWDQIVEFCKQNNIKHVAELHRCPLAWLVEDDFKAVKNFLDDRYFDGVIGFRNALWLGENKNLVDEGICIRADGLTPRILKAKSPKFLEHETKILDTGEEDLESSQSNEQEIGIS